MRVDVGGPWRGGGLGVVVVIVCRRHACNWCAYAPSHLSCSVCGRLVGVVVVVGVGVNILLVVVGVGAVIIVVVIVVVVVVGAVAGT